MEAARRIRERDQNVIILFITNRTDYALQGYQVDALDYVIKPVTYFAFADRLERALERLKKRASRSLILSLPDGILRLQVADIFYIESDRHNLVYHTVNGEVTVRQKMQDAEESLTGAGFYRIHKGYLVNLAHVDGIRGGDCLIRGRALPVSRTRRNEFMKVLMNYLGE
jgi:DNA-binding LytR/AlgR family response regulator